MNRNPEFRKLIMEIEAACKDWWNQEIDDQQLINTVGSVSSELRGIGTGKGA